MQRIWFQDKAEFSIGVRVKKTKPISYIDVDRSVGEFPIAIDVDNTTLHLKDEEAFSVSLAILNSLSKKFLKENQDRLKHLALLSTS
jgi:hypothetical protein